jgi:hypothetical protein
MVNDEVGRGGSTTVSLNGSGAPMTFDGFERVL